MDCDQIQRRLETGGDVRDADASAHLRACEACAAMVAAADRLARAPAPSSGGGPVWADVLAAIERDDRPVARARSWSTPRRLAVGLLAAVVVPLVVLLVTPRPDLGVYPAVRAVLESLGLALAIGWAAALTLRPLHRPTSTASVRAAALLSVAVIVVLASLPAAHHDHVASLAGAGADRFARAAGCLIFGTLCAVPAWFALRLLARDGDRLGLRAVLVAAASAAVGALGTYLHCPIVHPLHLWLGHATVMVLPWVWALIVARSRVTA